MGLRVESDRLYSINPQDGKIIGEFQAVGIEQINDIVQKAKTAFNDWADLSFTARHSIIKTAYHQFYLHREEIAELISAETGKPQVEAFSSEILPVLDCFKYYLKHIHRFLKEKSIKASNPFLKLRKGFVKYRPLGTIAIISPWNYPLLLSMQHIIPALLAGNVVIHKPSEYTSLTGLKIRELFNLAFLPKNVLSVVTGLAETGRALAEAKLDKIIFTGSTSVGQKIYESAAKNLAPVNMELGGSDPMIVLDDADFGKAVNAALWGAFTNAGQACLSVERIYVQEGIKDRFLESLIQRARNIRMTSQNSPGEMSCLINETQLSKMQRLIQEALDKGAVLCLGGKQRKDLGNYFFEPTILTEINSSMEISKTEIFGPVMTINTFLTDEEAVFLANNSEFGLSASIWTKNRRRGLTLAKQLEAGAVLINDVYIHIAQFEAPYTGYKKSGIGVSHGPWGVMELVRPQYFSMERSLLPKILYVVCKPLAKGNIWWFPYRESLLKDFKTFIDFLHHNTILGKIKSVPKVIKAVFRKY